MAWAEWAVNALDGRVGALRASGALGAGVCDGEVVCTADRALRRGGALISQVSEGLALSALGCGKDLEIGLQAADCVEEGHAPNTECFHIAGDWEGDDHCGLFLVLAGKSSGQPMWDLGQYGEFGCKPANLTILPRYLSMVLTRAQEGLLA
ncbi:hypothetical protein Q9L58_002510, partial [Maublancomyces gigas]